MASTCDFVFEPRADGAVDPFAHGFTFRSMNAVEFTTELTGEAALAMPAEVAAQLPKAGRARVIVLLEESGDAVDWQVGAYAQFLRDDPPEDAIYDAIR